MRHTPALTINVIYFGDKPTLTVSVGARYPAEFNASVSILQREGKPVRYLAALQGYGVPKIMAEGGDAIEAALTLGHRTAKYLEQIDDRLSACPPDPYIDEHPENWTSNASPDDETVRSVDRNGVEVVSRKAPPE